MDAVALRRFVYDELIALGMPPRSDAIATHFGVTAAEARDAIRNLKIGKTVLPHPASDEIWMAGPFAAEPTDYAVSTASRRWFANCAWDMLGIAAIVSQPVTLEAKCTDCKEPFRIGLDPRGEVTSNWLVHFLRPARRWYEDIGFT
jgi:hypothetical protein